MTGVLDQENTDDCPKSVLGKTRLLLGAFGSGAYRLTLTELSRRSGVPKATAHRLAQELVEWGMLDRADDGGYQLGLRVFELGQRVPVSGVLRTLARPMLADLFVATRLTNHLAVLDGTHVLYLDKIAGEANVNSHSRIGGRLPASCTVTGKVLLAMSADGPAALDRLTAGPLARPTSRSVGSVAALRRQLADVVARGYAVESEELLLGCGAVAVPVTTADGETVASISVTGPLDRMVVHRLVPQLRRTAVTVARAIDRSLPARPDEVAATR